MFKDLVTIIVPVYNAEKHIQKCLNSISNQTYNNIEVIIVNDGSKDNSLEICESFLIDSRFTIIDKLNEGLSKARQVGIDKSNGIYICTIDSDDWIEPEFVEKMYNKIKKEDADICVCGWKTYENGSVIVNGIDIDLESVKRYSKTENELNLKKMLSKYYLSDSWNKMYLKEFLIFSEVKFSLERQFIGTDMLFNLLLFLHQPKIVGLNESLLNYNVLIDSKSRKKNKPMMQGFISIISTLKLECKKLEYSERITEQLSLLYIDFLYLTGLSIMMEESNYFRARNRLVLLNCDLVHYEIDNLVNLKTLKVEKIQFLFLLLLKSKLYFFIFGLFKVRNVYNLVKKQVNY